MLERGWAEYNGSKSVLSGGQAGFMVRQRVKSDFPSKLCAVCQRPFTWRKKWASCWEEVKYCSERCRRHRQDPKAADKE